MCLYSRLIAFALLAALASTAAAQVLPPDFRTELRPAIDAKANKQWPTVITTVDKLLPKFKEPAQVREMRLLKAEALLNTKKYTEAYAELSAVQKDFPADKEGQLTALVLMGDGQRLEGKFADAVASYQKAAKDYADQGEPAADAQLKSADVLATDLKKYPESLVAYKAVETQFGSQIKQAAEAARRAAAINETQTKDLAAAGAAYFAAADKYAAANPEAARKDLYAKAVDMYRAAQKFDDAANAAKKAEAAMETPLFKSQFAAYQVLVLNDLKKYPDARNEADRLITTYPLQLDACQAAQAAVVESYKAEGKFPEMLGAAKTQFDAAGTQQAIAASAAAVAAAFRSADGNLSRANEFLTYQRFGSSGPPGPDGKPGAADSVANPLAKVAYAPSNPVRDQKFQAALQALSNDYDAARAKAYLYVYWGKPKESAGAFRQAFKLAAEKDVAQAAQELVLVGMKAHTGSFWGLDKIFEYLSFGPKGADGKQNLPDPFAGL